MAYMVHHKRAHLNKFYSFLAYLFGINYRNFHIIYSKAIPLSILSNCIAVIGLKYNTTIWITFYVAYVNSNCNGGVGFFHSNPIYLRFYDFSH